MRAMFLVCACLIVALLTAAQPQLPSDPYSVEFVSTAFHFFRDRTPRNGSDFKQFLFATPSLPELGDRASIAMLKILKPSELVERDNAYAYLGVVSFAFAYPKRTARDADLEPKVTMFVLDYLKEKETADPELETRIALVAGCVQTRTCESAPENAYRKP